MSIRLTPRDEAIIEHVCRYRITTIEVLHRLYFEPGATQNAVSQVLLRLINSGHLKRSEKPIIGSQNYYQLTARTALEQGEEETFAHPPGATSLIFHYMMLEYCCLGEVRREHITSREIRTGFPSLNGRGIARHAYFHTHDEPVRIGWLEVDCGNRAETRAKKCLKQYKKRVEAPELRFAELEKEGRFGLVLIAPSEGKQRALTRVFVEKLPAIPIEIVVSKRLGELLGRGPLQAEAKEQADEGQDEDTSWDESTEEKSKSDEPLTRDRSIR